MMRLLPRSLFARMVLILLGGLVAAQLLSFAIHWQERGEFIMRATGTRSAQRIADIVRLLDSIAPADRARIVSVLNSPPLRISLGEPPLAPIAGDGEKEDQATQYAAVLKRALGENYPLVVNVTDARSWGGPGPGYGMGPGMMGGPGRWGTDAGAPGQFGPGAFGPGMRRHAEISFIVQARLQDGTLVTFNSRQSSEAVNWPYRLLLSLLVLLAVVFAVTLVAVRWVTRPLKTLAAAAQSLGDDLNRPPLEEKGPIEVSRAARLRLRAELLDDPELRAKFEKDLQEMEVMVSAALDFMRGLDLQEPRQPLDVMALLESLQADAREVGGKVEIEGAARAPYRGHPQTLKRCLRNLIDNAVKYGNSATIVVADAAGQLRICVRDAGPGIPEAELELVFEPFHRREVSRNRSTGGTGLGLTIARNIARAHGGELVLRNRPTGGLEAVLTLPRNVA
ncbi:MAG: HAMP domain-containing protein [Betaproteobacteria bacterium]|nr:HAMP domain-containing protein [Betaproteobacteria bacterium]